MTHTITSRVATPNGAKYVTQLCKHWSHKFEVVMDGNTGTVPFGSATATMVADDTGIRLAVAGDDRATVERLADVLAKHVDRFAFREDPLTYDWHWQDTA